MAEPNKTDVDTDVKVDIDNVKLSDAKKPLQSGELTEAEQDSVAGGGTYGGSGNAGA